LANTGGGGGGASAGDIGSDRFGASVGSGLVIIAYPS
jgi:hypothetical protein